MKKERKLEAEAAAHIPEDVEALDPKAENYLWVTLQKRYSCIPEAFAFLKGRTTGKHAHLLSEPELCNGLLRLNLMEQLIAASDTDAIAKLLRNPSYDSVSMMQKKDILIAAKGLTSEAARGVLRRAGVDERGIRRNDQETESKPTKSEDGAPPARTNPFEGTQGKALFRRFNASCSGWLTQGEFIQALSQWTKSHKSLIQQQPAAQSPPHDTGSSAAPKRLLDLPSSPVKGGGGTDGLGRSPMRASAERPRSALSQSVGGGGKARTEAQGTGGTPLQRDYEQNIWPTFARDAVSKKDAHEMLERVRREEAELLKGKLKTIREQEDRLQVTMWLCV